MGDVEKRCEELLASTRKLAQALDGIGGGGYGALVEVCDRLAREIAPLDYPAAFCLTGPSVAPLESLGPESYSDAGGKATNLALIASGAELSIPTGPWRTELGRTSGLPCGAAPWARTRTPPLPGST